MFEWMQPLYNIKHNVTLSFLYLQDYAVDIFYVFEGNRLVHK